MDGDRDSRFALPYNMTLLGEQVPADAYNVNVNRVQHAQLLQSPLQSPLHHPRHGLKRPADQCYDERQPSQQQQQQQQQQQLAPLDVHCAMQQPQQSMDQHDDGYAPLQPKKSPPSNGKKTKGRVKIKMEYIDNKLRRYTTFSKRKTGIMKKAYELSTLTGTQVMLLVASETGHVYTFATRKLQPMITSDSGKRLIQTCLNSPDPPVGAAAHGGDQRMSATGFEETELTYNIGDEETKVERSPLSSAGDESGEESGSEPESPSQNQRSISPDLSIVKRENNADGNAIFNAAGGVLYPPGVILSLAAAAQGQDQGGTSQPQFITIPLSMAMAAAAASQTTTVASNNQQTNGLQDLSRSSRK